MSRNTFYDVIFILKWFLMICSIKNVTFVIRRLWPFCNVLSCAAGEMPNQHHMKYAFCLSFFRKLKFITESEWKHFIWISWCSHFNVKTTHKTAKKYSIVTFKSNILISIIGLKILISIECFSVRRGFLVRLRTIASHHIVNWSQKVTNTKQLLVSNVGLFDRIIYCKPFEGSNKMKIRLVIILWRRKCPAYENGIEAEMW